MASRRAGPLLGQAVGVADGRGKGPSRRPRKRRSPARIGLALAGGGPLGAIYEIGALCALQDCITGLAVNELDGYVGVSAGGMIAAALANGMTPRQLCAAFIEGQSPLADRIDPDLFLRPAWGEYARRWASLPWLVTESGVAFALGQRSWLASLERLGRALPTGLFSNSALQQRLREVFSAPGRSDDFRQLRRPLVVVATDLDSGAAAPFGTPGWDAVPISEAVAASAALPGLFPPLSVNGPQGQRWYVDGALKKTLHARVLLDMGLDLVIALNPLVPFDAAHELGPLGRAASTQTAPWLSKSAVLPPIPHVVQGGLPLVLSQTFRTLIHSRLELGLKGYETSHPQTDIVLFEPDHRDGELFLANIFGYGQRRQLAEHAYQSTRADLRARRVSLAATLSQHGLALNESALNDASRRLLPAAGAGSAPRSVGGAGRGPSGVPRAGGASSAEAAAGLLATQAARPKPSTLGAMQDLEGVLAKLEQRLAAQGRASRLD
jgi:NTE family protein